MPSMKAEGDFRFIEVPRGPNGELPDGTCEFLFGGVRASAKLQRVENGEWVDVPVEKADGRP